MGYGFYNIKVGCCAFALFLPRTTRKGDLWSPFYLVKNRQKTFELGFYNIGVIYSSVALHIRTPNLFLKTFNRKKYVKRV